MSKRFGRALGIKTIAKRELLARIRADWAPPAWRPHPDFGQCLVDFDRICEISAERAHLRHSPKLRCDSAELRDLGRSCPKLDRIRPAVGELWSMSAEFGSRSAKLVPSSARSGRIRADLAQLSQTLARFRPALSDFGCMWIELRQFSAGLGQHGPISSGL